VTAGKKKAAKKFRGESCSGASTGGGYE
jgi:hypothetical protein